MKLRVAPEKISYRLDFDELEQLLTQGHIRQKIELPQADLTYEIAVLPTGSPAAFTAKDGIYILSLARDVITNHKSTLPSLDGINNSFATAKGNKIDVALEINLKKKIKHSLE